MITVWLLPMYMKARDLHPRTRRNLFTCDKRGRKPFSCHGFCMHPVFRPTTSLTPRFRTLQTIPRIFEAAPHFRSHTSLLCQRPPCCISLSARLPSKDSITQISHWMSVFIVEHKKVKSKIFFVWLWKTLFGMGCYILCWILKLQKFFVYWFQPNSLRWVETKSYINIYMNT